VIDFETMPPGQQSEFAVLAAIIFQNEILDEITLTDEDFYDSRLGKVYSNMIELRRRGRAIDPTSLSHLDPKSATLHWDITSAPYSYAPLHHADLVRENSTRRRLMTASLVISTMAKDGEVPIEEVADRARTAVDDAIGVTQGATPTSGDMVTRVMQSIGTSEPVMVTPWISLTRTIRGFRSGGLYVIGARPGVGKSALALQCASTLESYGHVAYFTMEMPADEVTKRLISQETGIAYRMLDGAQPMPEFAQRKIADWQADYAGKILFDDRGVLTVSDIRAMVRTWSRQHKLSAVVVDYLQLMSGPSHLKKIELVTEISRQLKILARDFEIPVIALSQLNRQSEHRSDKVPALSDLRESGSIEQDADACVLLHRDMTMSAGANSYVDLIVAKNRQGPTGKVTLDWQGEFMRAAEYQP
jgi:replicative DNA helicase